MTTLPTPPGLAVPGQCDGLPLTPFLDGAEPPAWRDAAHYEFDWRHLLLPSIADSLAGRMATLSLWPLSGAELVGAPGFNRADCLFDGDLSALLAPPCERAQTRSGGRRRVAEPWLVKAVVAVKGEHQAGDPIAEPDPRLEQQ